MAVIATFLGGLGLVAAAQRPRERHPDGRARLEWLGGLLLVASLVGLGFELAQAG